jgi:hypothetical protein
MTRSKAERRIIAEYIAKAKKDGVILTEKDVTTAFGWHISQKIKNLK